MMGCDEMRFEKKEAGRDEEERRGKGERKEEEERPKRGVGEAEKTVTDNKRREELKESKISTVGEDVRARVYEEDSAAAIDCKESEVQKEIRGESALDNVGH